MGVGEDRWLLDRWEDPRAGGGEDNGPLRVGLEGPAVDDGRARDGGFVLL